MRAQILVTLERVSTMAVQSDNVLVNPLLHPYTDATLPCSCRLPSITTAWHLAEHFRALLSYHLLLFTSYFRITSHFLLLT